MNNALILFLHHTVLFGVRFGVTAEGVVKQYLFSVLIDQSWLWGGDVCSSGHVVLNGFICVYHSPRFRMTDFSAKT